MYICLLCSKTEPSIAHLSVGSNIFPLNIHFSSNGLADAFSRTYNRWLSFLPSSAAKYTYHLPLMKWISGAQMSLEYSVPAGGVHMVLRSALSRSERFFVFQISIRFP